MYIARILMLFTIFLLMWAHVSLADNTTSVSQQKLGMSRKELRKVRYRKRKARQKTPQRLARRRSRNLHHLTMKAGGLQKTLDEVTQIMQVLCPEKKVIARDYRSSSST